MAKQAAVAAKQASTKQADAGVIAAESGVRQAETDVTANGRRKTGEAEVKQANRTLLYEIHAPYCRTRDAQERRDRRLCADRPAALGARGKNVWVIANFKETQLDRMRPGQPVTVTVDAYPGVEFAAHVDSIQRGSGAWFSLLPPENATGNFVKVVQRVPVKIVFDDLPQVEQYALGPGMSVVPTVRLTASGATTADGGEVSELSDSQAVAPDREQSHVRIMPIA